MKRIIIIISFFYSIIGYSQSEIVEGIVTFTTSVNTYVRFINTDEISIGDTLYSVTDDIRTP